MVSDSRDPALCYRDGHPGRGVRFEVNAAVVTHGDHNALIHPAVRYNVTEHVEAELSGDIFLGPEETFFGQYQKDGRVIFQLSFLF